MWDLAAVRNLHFTMAKPWDIRHPCHKGFENLNQLWHAAFAEPHTLTRVLLRVHLAEKKAKQQHLEGGGAARDAVHAHPKSRGRDYYGKSGENGPANI